MKYLFAAISKPVSCRKNRKTGRVNRTLTSTIFALFASAALGQTYTDIHDFGYKINGPTGLSQQDGYLPSSGVTFDSAGNMYGTTQTGGTGGGSVLWKMTTAGVYSIVHNFGGKVVTLLGKVVPDGYDVVAGVTIDSNGNLLGTTREGGANGKGIVWEYTTSGVYFDRHDFGATVLNAGGTLGPDGTYPIANVTLDRSGNAYGTTEYGGPDGGGMVWKLSSTGLYTDLHDFGGSVASTLGVTGLDGYWPDCSVALDSSGNLYGTTLNGGPNTPTSEQGDGILWKISSAGVYSDLHDFGGTVTTSNGANGPDGIFPNSVTLDSAGNIYGTAGNGGPNNSTGMVWELTYFGTYIDLHDFGVYVPRAGGGGQLMDGASPLGGVTLDSAGNLYGTTSLRSGGGSNGNVWQITTKRDYKDLWDFSTRTVADIGGRNGSDGYACSSNVTFDQFGNLYGTTVSGGQDQYASGDGGTGGGIVWAIGSLQSVGLVPTSVAGGVKVTGTVNLGQAAPIGGTVVNLSSSESQAAAPPATVKVPYGSTSATFTILTGRSFASFPLLIQASQALTFVMSEMTVEVADLSGFSYFNGPKGGSTATIAVDLDGPARSGGVTVQLSSNSPSATVPSSVVVPAGATSVQFQISYASVASNTLAIITAKNQFTQNSVTANITIKP